jgi:SnoaL-like domain
MTPEQELVEAGLISRLKAQYVRFVDLKDWSALERLFAEGFVFEGQWSSRGGALFVERLSRHLADAGTVHELHWPEIEIASPDGATAIWPFSDIIDQRRNGAGMYRRGSGHYHESYIKAGGAWRIATMRITRIRVECTVFLPAGETRTHTCLSQDELVAWLREQEVS